MSTLRDILARSGFAAELVVFAAPGTPDVGNLYARFGSVSPNLAFAGHTDVVPPGDLTRWRFDPFSGETADGQLWGRGACDMKGGLAAAAAAALRFIAKRPFSGSISFLVTGDEEGPAVNGTVKLLEWALAKGERFDHCILGEPTSVSALGDTIKHGRRGSLIGRLAIHGRQGHVAYPHIAQNPIRALADVLTVLTSPPLDQGNADFEPSNLEVTSVDVGNPAANVIPAEVRLVFNVRFNNLWTPESLEAEIARRVAAAGGGARTTLTFEPTNAVAFLTHPGPFTDLVAAAVEDVTGRRPSPVDWRGHFRRPLHQHRLPGRRAWPRQRDHPRGRRAGRPRRSGGAVAHLRTRVRALFRRPHPRERAFGRKPSFDGLAARFQEGVHLV